MASAPTPVYLFAGDSLTEGIYGESYVDRVAAALSAGWAGLAGQAVNAGRGGDTLRSLLNRIDAPLAKVRPDWVILAVGGNDVWQWWLSRHSLGWWLWLLGRRLRGSQLPLTDLDQVAAAYRALIDKAWQAGAQVLACTISPFGEQLSSPPNRQLASLNGVIKRVASERGVPLADVAQAFVEELAVVPSPVRYTPGEWLSYWLDRRRMQTESPDEVSRRRRLHLTFDGIHLNSRGAELWAHTILLALARAHGALPS